MGRVVCQKQKKCTMAEGSAGNATSRRTKLNTLNTDTHETGIHPADSNHKEANQPLSYLTKKKHNNGEKNIGEKSTPQFRMHVGEKDPEGVFLKSGLDLWKWGHVQASKMLKGGKKNMHGQIRRL